MGSIELTALLWEERAALEQLVEAQDAVQRTLDADDLQAVLSGIARVQDVLDELRPVLLLRDVEVSVVADEWAAGDAPLAGLAGLAAHAPAGPWGDILADHLEALRALAARAIEQRRDVERRAAAIGVTTAYRLPPALRAHADG
jgi:hypothetical protein